MELWIDSFQQFRDIVPLSLALIISDEKAMVIDISVPLYIIGLLFFLAIFKIFLYVRYSEVRLW